jgi:hypothetical protein
VQYSQGGQVSKDEIVTAQQIADAVVRYASAYGLHVSTEANDLWDLVEQVAAQLPEPFAVATRG